MKPDSLLDAAKKTANALQMPWPAMQKTYRELQSKDDFLTNWIPKSQGRHIWYAHPNYIVRLLLAVGFSTSKLTAHQANYLGFILTPNGRGVHISERPSLDGTEFLSVLANLIYSEANAATVDEIEFDGGNKTVVIRTNDGTNRLFQTTEKHEYGTDDDLFESGIAAAANADTSSAMKTKLVITGKALQEISNAVKWRDESSLPFSYNADVDASD